MLRHGRGGDAPEATGPRPRAIGVAGINKGQEHPIY